MNNTKGVAIIIVFSIIMVLAILGTAILSRSISESNNAQRYAESVRAFWLAEAGINNALYQLRTTYSNMNAINTTGVGQGYNVGIAAYGVDRIVNSTGYVSATNVTHSLQAVISQTVPPDFYDNAIYSAGEVDLNGNAYAINGNVSYADELNYSQNNINGTVTQDAVSPLPRFNFQELRNQSSSQQNVYVVSGNKLVNQATGSQAFPSSFWYNVTTSTPNIVYIEGDLQLNGNIGAIGGFFVVVGDIITNPGAAEDASINGNGQVNGLFYTRGEFDINGGGGNLNVNGGVWAGEEAELNGNANITYNQTYMDAVRSLNLAGSAQISSWEDRKNPYQLSW